MSCRGLRVYQLPSACDESRWQTTLQNVLHCKVLGGTSQQPVLRLAARLILYLLLLEYCCCCCANADSMILSDQRITQPDSAKLMRLETRKRTLLRASPGCSCEHPPEPPSPAGLTPAESHPKPSQCTLHS